MLEITGGWRKLYIDELHNVYYSPLQNVYYSLLQNMYYSPLHNVYCSPLHNVYYSPAFRWVFIPPVHPIKTAPHAATAQQMNVFLRSSVMGTFVKVCRNVQVLIKDRQRYLPWRSACFWAYIGSNCLTFMGARDCGTEVVDENDERFKPKNFQLFRVWQIIKHENLRHTHTSYPVHSPPINGLQKAAECCRMCNRFRST